MKISGFLIALLSLYPLPLHPEDLTATLPDGRQVLLREDGTWSFIEPKVSSDTTIPHMGPLPPLSSQKAETKVIPKDPDDENSRDRVQLTLHIYNNSEEKVRAWKAILTVKDPFGEQLFKQRLTSGSSSIEPKETKKITFEWKDDPEEKREPYDYLLIYNPDVLKIELSEIEIAK